MVVFVTNRADQKMSEGEKKTLQQSLRDTWMNALGVLNGAEAEVAKTTHRVLETMGIAPAGSEPGAQLPEVKDVVREIFQRVQRNRADLERRIDDGIRSAIDRTRRPFVQDIEQIRTRVDKLQRRVEELSRRGRAKPRSSDNRRR